MVAEETRTAVQAEEAKASEKASVAQEIATDAQKDLDAALPALDAALTSLKSLNKNDVVEVPHLFYAAGRECPSREQHLYILLVLNDHLEMCCVAS